MKLFTKNISPKAKTLNFSEFLQQDSQSSYSFGKIQNVGEIELSEEKRCSVSLEKDFIICSCIYFFASFPAYFLVSDI